MENQKTDLTDQKQKEPKKNLQISWKETEVSRLSKALTFCFSNAKRYDEELDLEDRIMGFKFVLMGKFTMDQVLSAFKIWMSRSTEMIKPAYVNNILDPIPKKITTAEYVNAKKFQEKNNNPHYSPESILIRDYEAQNAEDRAPLHKNPVYPLLASRFQESNKQIEKEKSEPEETQYWDDLSLDAKDSVLIKANGIKGKLRKLYLDSYKVPENARIEAFCDEIAEKEKEIA
jgi:hypothetical protein